MAAGSTYTPIATTTLGSATNLVSFTSISGSYTDLVFVFTGTNATSSNGMRVRVNGDTGSNYSFTQLYGNGSSAASARGSSETSCSIFVEVGANQSTGIAHFQNYSNSTTYKTILSRGSAANTTADASVGLWRNTAAITSMEFRLTGGATSNFATGSTFTLYGILAA
jgi:hypothetical protein